MTEEPKEPKEPKADPELSEVYLKLKEEMNQQIQDLKNSFTATIQEKDDEINKLKEQNVDLQRALVRSAVTDPPKEPKKEPTEEELYEKEIERLRDRAKQFISELG